jgi:hypothetical protein
MGVRKTGNENIAPMATQPNRPPAATITQRQREWLILISTAGLSGWKTNGMVWSRRDDVRAGVLSGCSRTELWVRMVLTARSALIVQI